MKIVDRRQRILITDAPERVSVIDRRQRILIGPAPRGVAPEPPVDFFYGLAGGLARYDARTLGLADGAPVAAWGDASGQIGDAVCVDPGRCPLYSAALPGLRFDASGRYMHLPAELRFSLPAEWSVVVLVERLARNPFQSLLTLGREATSIEYSLAAAGSNNIATHYGGAFGQATSDSWPNGLSTVARVADGSVATVYRDDVLLLTRSAGSTEAEPDALPSIGARVDATGQVAGPFNGIVHDLLFFDRALSPAELATVRAGLTADWSL